MVILRQRLNPTAFIATEGSPMGIKVLGKARAGLQTLPASKDDVATVFHTSTPLHDSSGSATADGAKAPAPLPHDDKKAGRRNSFQDSA